MDIGTKILTNKSTQPCQVTVIYAWETKKIKEAPKQTSQYTNRKTVTLLAQTQIVNSLELDIVFTGLAIRKMPRISHYFTVKLDKISNPLN